LENGSTKLYSLFCYSFINNRNSEYADDTRGVTTMTMEILRNETSAILRQYQAWLQDHIHIKLRTPQSSRHTFQTIVRSSFAEFVERFAVRPHIVERISLMVVILDKSERVPDHERLTIGSFGSLSLRVMSIVHGVPTWTAPDAGGASTPRTPNHRTLELRMYTLQSVSALKSLVMMPHDYAWDILQDPTLVHHMARMYTLPHHVDEFHVASATRDIVHFQEMLRHTHNAQRDFERVLEEPLYAPLVNGVFVFLRRWQNA
jgi:hypothetical protein